MSEQNDPKPVAPISTETQETGGSLKGECKRVDKDIEMVDVFFRTPKEIQEQEAEIKAGKRPAWTLDSPGLPPDRIVPNLLKKVVLETPSGKTLVVTADDWDSADPNHQTPGGYGVSIHEITAGGRYNPYVPLWGWRTGSLDNVLQQVDKVVTYLESGELKYKDAGEEKNKNGEVVYAWNSSIGESEKYKREHSE